MAASQLYNKDGVEYPTHTTPHNQVVAVTIADPSDDTMENYVQLKQERELTWDQVAEQVSVQDPALADYLRANGPAFEKSHADKADAAKPELLTELAHNPLSTKDEREAAAKSAGSSTPPVAGTTTSKK